MSPGQILPEQMSPEQLKSVQDGPRNLFLMFGQNRVSNSWDIDDIEFEVVLLRVGGWVSENGNKAISASIEFEVELS